MANPPRKGHKQIRALFEDVLRRDQDAVPEWRDPELARDGIKPGQYPGAPYAMPEKCPVEVIGRDDEGTVYCLSATGHLRKMEKWDAPALANLFAPHLNFALWAWPAWGKKQKKTTDPETGEEILLPLKIERLEAQKCAMAIIQRAGELPSFDPLNDHRGRGGWTDKLGRFIWHSGEYLWMIQKQGNGPVLLAAKPAKLDGFLYTRQHPTIRPWEQPVSAADGPAAKILGYLKTWNWDRPYLDPILLLGWIVTSIMGGALKERPIVFTVGGHGVGKTTLHGLIKEVLRDMVFTAVDTTAAGIYQKVRHDALPFLVDELEAKAGSTKAQSVIELARVAYSGGDISRGGADHESVTFKMHTSFFFSAINPPPMGSQDKSRMAMLSLLSLNKDGGPRTPPKINEMDGRMLLRQVMDGWDRFNSTLLQSYWEALHAQKFDARQIDTYGTLLAAAELVVGPEALEAMGLPVRDTAMLGEIIKAATALERNETLPNWHKCLNILFDTTIDAWRDGIKPVIGQVCENFRIGDWDVKAARERLALVNLGAVQPGMLGLDSRCLAVPPDGTVLDRIFANTEFLKGGWSSALKQAPAHIVIKNPAAQQNVNIAGNTKRCLFVDLEAFHKHTGSVAD